MKRLENHVRRGLLAGVLVAAAAAAALGPLAAARAAPETLYVKTAEARLRDGPKMYKPAKEAVALGAAVTVVDRQADGWLNVRAPSGATGWIHESALADKPVAATPPGRGAGGAGRFGESQATRDEVALAGKGFNPQVEGRRRQDRPDLEASYGLVDRMQARAVPPGELDAFLRAGGLGEYGRKP